MDKIILSALDAIPVAELSYTDWIRIGMALKQEGYPCSVWDDWSRNDSRYKAGECDKKWSRSFRGSSKPVTGGTIVMMAKQYGWTASFDGAMNWNSAIEYDGNSSADHSMASRHPADELITFLRVLYEPNDYVAYVVGSRLTDKGKYIPSNKGNYSRTRDQLIADLQKYPDDIASAIGDWNTAAGAWIHLNPVDGKGVKDENVTRYKYALVECDDMPIADQYEIMRELNLPIATLVHSGGKSLHAAVHIDASNVVEYSERVDRLYQYLDEHGLKVDKNNRNPARLSRMPSVTRNGNVQRLIATNIGSRTWNDWIDYIEGAADDLPDFENLSSLDINNPPQPPEELITGILRCGHKLLISGASKAGKSFLIMQLCIAIAEGREWLGFKCKQGRVLYVNLEIDPNSAVTRIADIYKAWGIPNKNSGNIDMWNLRGHALPLDKLVPKLVRKMRGNDYAAVVIDPIYKVITGDENNASEMGAFCNQFDKICNETGAAAIYCHHHSKGAQGTKRAMDRASGSGVFARDPDAQLDIIELVLTGEVKNYVQDGNATAWRMESSLREFPNIKPVNFWFEYPIHRVDTTGELAKLNAEGSAAGNRQKSPKVQKGENWREKLDTAYENAEWLNESRHPIKITQLAEYAEVDSKTIKNWIDRTDGAYKRENGIVWRVEETERK